MRKLFGTDGIRGEANAYPVTAEIALSIGKAAAQVLTEGKNHPKFIIGKDTRLSGYMLEYAITSGLASAGADALLVGPMPTPAIAHLVRSFGADAGIMISASHNPAKDNGIKLFDSRGYKLPDSVEEKIERIVLGKNVGSHTSPEKIGKAHRIDDAQGRYIEFAKGSVENISLKGLKIVIDCANGAGYKVSPLIFRELGAEVIVINNQPDGNNINQESGALHPEVAKAAVLGHQADVGITLDGDADRVIMIDEKGGIIDGDFIIALSAINLKEKGLLKNDSVVVTQYTNLAFDALMKKHGITTHRVENGDRYVIDLMRKKGFNLGGENSGHIIFSDHNSTGDGTISALQVLRIMHEENKPLSLLAGCLERYPQVLINVDVDKKVPFDKLPSVKEALTKAEDALGKDGRIFVRYSGTQMKARVLVEGREKAVVERSARDVARSIKAAVGKGDKK